MQMYGPQDTVAGWFGRPGSRSPLHNLSAVTSGKSTFLVPVFLSLKGKGNTSYSYTEDFFLIYEFYFFLSFFFAVLGSSLLHRLFSSCGK